MKPIVIVLWVLAFSSLFVCAKDVSGEIIGAVRYEEVEKVKADLAADTNAANFVLEKRYTLLHFAAEHGSSNGLQILKLVLANGAKVDARNHIGQTPLYSAVIYNNPEGARILIEHGAQVNVRQDGGGTPLHAAAINGYCDVARVLIKNNSAINAKNSDGQTPLGLALDGQRRSKVDGDPPVIKRYDEMVTFLRQNGAK
jgi:hypothetical protein